ncbi:MAG TPA: transcription termination factor NusA [Candidatus Moranbacteria bacterium]|nr:transcription termination factor NusA [Candidatus Moranbacteria bacterium]
MAKKRTKKDEENNSGGRTGDFSSAISALCEEKGISKEKVVETIEAALSAAYKKDYGKRGQNIRSEFDELTGGAKFFLVKEVVDETMREFMEETDEADKKTDKAEEKKQIDTEENAEERLPRFNPERDLILEEAKKIKKDAKVGDIIETELEQKTDYGRVAAQTAKQVIIQRIREAERDAMYDEYKNKEGEILNGVVQRVEGRNIFVDLGKSVGVLFPSEQIERENYRVGQRIKVYLQKVDAGTKGPGITLSRTNPEMVRKMFELEVPEIFSGTVEIKSIAREAGERTKIAVSSTEDGIDPIGSCVGQKGTRVQAVIDELGGEKIDIVMWNDDISKFISGALSPAKVLKVEINEERKEASVSVLEDQLSLAIGKRGQNVRLAAKLTGWKIDIKGLAPSGGEQVSADEEGKKEEGSKKEEVSETEESKKEISEEVKEEKKEKKAKKTKETKEAENKEE